MMQIAFAVLGSLALSVAIVFGIFAIIARAQTAHVERVAAEEGVVKRTDRTATRSILRDYQSARRYSSYRYSRGRGVMLLTKKALEVVTTPMAFRFVEADIAHLTLKAQGDDALMLATNAPPDAKGTVELTVWLPDAEAWIEALVARGAKRA